jgi:hypothetical protein
MKNKEEIINFIIDYRLQLANYRVYKDKNITSLDVNSIEIGLNLLDLAVRQDRIISKEEQQWYKGGYYVQMIFENSEWEVFYDLYQKMVEIAKQYFK